MRVENKGIFSDFISEFGVSLKKNRLNNRLGDLLISKGFITSQDLNTALDVQSKVHKPLGQVFVESAKISRYQLAAILGKQYLLRGCAAAVMLLSLSFSMPGRAQAGAIKDVPAKLVLANVSAEFARVSSYPALYGTNEKRSTNLKAFTKWTGMFERFESDLRRDRSARVIRKWQKDLGALQGGSVKSLARKVNDFVNESRYITDSKNWGKSDYWATPAEFIQRGGDCEDFAIAKYTALRALGVPEERLRVMIVQDTYKDIPHAVLVVYTESGAFILDNQIKTLVSTDSGSRYRPIFSINRTAWWLHGKPGSGTTRVASAR